MKFLIYLYVRFMEDVAPPLLHALLGVAKVLAIFLAVLGLLFRPGPTLTICLLVVAAHWVWGRYTDYRSGR